MKREGFVMYRTFVESIRNLPAEQFKSCILAVADYALDGIEYEGDDPVVNMYFALVKPQIEANNRRYENGRKGGRPKAEKPEEPLAEVESIPLNDGSEWKPTRSEYEEMCRLYPNVDIPQEFSNMRGWSNGNPKRKKTPTGVKRFVNGWLAKEQNKPKRFTQPSIKIGMPEYMHQQIGGTLAAEVPASQETKDMVRKMQEGMNV